MPLHTTEEKTILFFTGIANVMLFTLAACYMWRWFVVPQFNVMQEVEFWKMLGLITMIRFVVTKTNFKKEEDPRTFPQKFWWDLLASPFMLLIAWGIHFLAARHPWPL